MLLSSTVLRYAKFHDEALLHTYNNCDARKTMQLVFITIKNRQMLPTYTCVKQHMRQQPAFVLHNSFHRY